MRIIKEAVPAGTGFCGAHSSDCEKKNSPRLLNSLCFYMYDVRADSNRLSDRSVRNFRAPCRYLNHDNRGNSFDS